MGAGLPSEGEEGSLCESPVINSKPFISVVSGKEPLLVCLIVRRLSSRAAQVAAANAIRPGGAKRAGNAAVVINRLSGSSAHVSPAVAAGLRHAQLRHVNENAPKLPKLHFIC